MADPSERIRELEAEVEGLKAVEVEAAQDIARLFVENQRMLPVVEAADRETAAEDDVTEAEGEAFDGEVDVVCAPYDKAEDDARGIRRAAVHAYRIAEARDPVSRLARIQAVYNAAVKWRHVSGDEDAWIPAVEALCDAVDAAEGKP